MSRPPTHSYRGSRGFTLVEVMIALLLGIMLILGITQIAARNSLTGHEIDRTSRQLESASYALRTIESDLRSSGFWGETAPEPDGVLPPLCAGLNVDIDGAMAELGFVDGTPTAATSILGYPVQGEVSGLDCIASSLAPGTEFLAIRRASSCSIGSAGCSPEDDSFFIQSNACFTSTGGAALTPGDFRINDDVAEMQGGDYQMRDCATDAPIYKILNRIYFVNNEAQLVRAELQGTGAAAQYVEIPIVDGVETLRFEYGLDTDDDGQVDTQTTLPSGIEWQDVVLVRIHLMVRNLEPSGGVDQKTYTVDGTAFTIPTGFESHRRQLHSRAVSLRNVAGRRG